MRGNKELNRTAGRKGERGVALIIVLGFLGLMLMMAVAFMTQARVERLVSDSSMEAMRARQIAQTGIAAGIQDYVNAIQQLESQSDDEHFIFLSGDHDTGQYSFANEKYGSANLWSGKVKDWVWAKHRDGEKEDSVENMKWIWVCEEPGKMSRILGRYAYACFDMSGAVDANLLGREFGEDVKSEQYGAQTNRNNVRKMVLDAVRAEPGMETKMQERLAQYQAMWQGFDTPLALKKLTDGKANDGQDGGENRWSAIGNDESGVGQLSDDHLACYSYAAFHKGSGEGGWGNGRWEFTKDITTDRDFQNKLGKLTEASVDVLRPDTKTWVEKALKDYMDEDDVPSGVDYPSVEAVPMFNEIRATLKLTNAPNPAGGYKPKMELQMDYEFWYPFTSFDNNPTNSPKKNGFFMQAPNVAMGNKKQSVYIEYRAKIEGGSYIQPVLESKVEDISVGALPKNSDHQPSWSSTNVWSFNVQSNDWYFGATKQYTLTFEPTNVISFKYDIYFPDAVTQKVQYVQLGDIVLSNSVALKFANGVVCDALPGKLPVQWEKTHPTLYPQEADVPNSQKTMRAYAEVKDPRLNHDKDMWVSPSSGEDSLGKLNYEMWRAVTNVTDKPYHEAGKLDYAPGLMFYCRNGAPVSPAELGYIPVWDGKTPWNTLDIFSDEGIELMNRLVCTSVTNVADWKLLEERKVYYTNGTINPYTADQAVLNGAFYGLDLRIPGIADSTNFPLTESLLGSAPGGSNTCWVLGKSGTKNLTEELLKTETPDKQTFIKDGPAGWARVLRKRELANAGTYPYNPKKPSDPYLVGHGSRHLDKNQRVALVHNTWGLFNESDRLFVIVVVAQSISEAPSNVDPVGHWDKDEDMITGERWAVALCWTDASADVGQDLTKETDIIMFQYLNE